MPTKLSAAQQRILERMGEGWELRSSRMGRVWLERNGEREPVHHTTLRVLAHHGVLVRETPFYKWLAHDRWRLV